MSPFAWGPLPAVTSAELLEQSCCGGQCANPPRALGFSAKEGTGRRDKLILLVAWEELWARMLQPRTVPPVQGRGPPKEGRWPSGLRSGLGSFPMGLLGVGPSRSPLGLALAASPGTGLLAGAC